MPSLQPQILGSNIQMFPREDKNEKDEDRKTVIWKGGAEQEGDRHTERARKRWRQKER